MSARVAIDDIGEDSHAVFSVFDVNHAGKQGAATLKRFLSLVLAASTILASHAFAQDLDLIIRGGSLIDGSGSPRNLMHLLAVILIVGGQPLRRVCGAGALL